MKIIAAVIVSVLVQSCASQSVPCLSEYLGMPKTHTGEKCEAVRYLSECISTAESTGISADAITQLETLLQQAQLEVKDNCVEHVPPSIRTSRDGLNVKVDGDEDVVFTRHRRADVSIFALSNKVDALDTKIDAVPTSEDIKAAVGEGVAGAISALSSLTKDELKDSREHFANVIATAMNNISAAADANADELKAAIASIKDKASKDDVEELKHSLRDLEFRCQRGYEFEVKPHTETQNRKCQEFTECKTEQFEKTAGTADKDRVCAAKTVCTKGKQFESDSGSATKDRTCKKFTVCTKAQFEKVKPTTTSDRECGTGLSSCKKYLDADSSAENGFYLVKQKGGVLASLWCDMKSGGWTLVGRQMHKASGRGPNSIDMFAKGCKCGTQGKNFGRYSTCLRDCNFVHDAQNNNPLHDAVKDDGAKSASDLSKSKEDLGFFTSGVIGKKHRMVWMANGKIAAPSSQGCPSKQEGAFDGTIHGAMKIAQYPDSNNPAAIHRIVTCHGGAHGSRSLWIDTGKIWGSTTGGENDELCDTNCGNGGDFGGQPRGRTDELRLWTL